MSEVKIFKAMLPDNLSSKEVVVVIANNTATIINSVYPASDARGGTVADDIVFFTQAMKPAEDCFWVHICIPFGDKSYLLNLRDKDKPKITPVEKKEKKKK